MIGMWELRGSEPKLYTKRAADIIKNKRTGKEYIRGKMKLFKVDVPEPVENTGEYEFVYLNSKKMAIPTSEEMLKEIQVNTILKR